jgi:ATP-dependent protease Clp ATPase subunit
VAFWTRKQESRAKQAADVLRCSFCSRSRRDVAKLIAGPAVFICNDCVGTCNQIIAEDATLQTPVPQKTAEGQDDQKSACILCRQVLEPALTIYILGRGLMCVNCVEVVRRAADQGWEAE